MAGLLRLHRLVGKWPRARPDPLTTGPKTPLPRRPGRSGPRRIFSPSRAGSRPAPRSSSPGWRFVRGARVAGYVVAFEVGNAEALPYLESQFDTTVTMFGAMFAYRPERTVGELLRVTRPGGRVAMANWTPDGFVGQMVRAHTALVPSPSGVPSPLEWGEEDVVRARLGGGSTSVTCTRRTLELRFPFPPAAVTELFATCYGPTVATLRASDPDGASRLRQELTRLFQQHNVATDGITTVVGHYLDVHARVSHK